MSCWVVPSVAADLWGIPVSQVLDRIRAGLIPSRQELGFTIVDVAPQAPKPASSRPSRPLTYMALVEDEDADTFTADWRERRMQVSLLRRRPAA
jgi:hypothetical protein